MKYYNKLLFLYLTLISSQAFAQSAPIHFTVLHTNDHHGHYWTNAAGEFGMAARQTLFKRIRKEVNEAGGFVLTLSGGDINTGTIESDMWYAEPDFYAMNLLGYDAMALGNHEFDHTLDLTLQQANWANFPFLSANTYSKITGERIFQPYEIFERMGLKVGIVGLTTQASQYITTPLATQWVDFRNPIDDADAVVTELRSQNKADVVIGLTHMGHYPNFQPNIYNQSAVDDIRLAQLLPTGALDLIVGGHSQTKICMPAQAHHSSMQEQSNCLPDKVNGTWIVQAQDWGKYVGRADFVYESGQLTLKRYQLIDVNLQGSKTARIEPDPEVKAFLTPYYEASKVFSQHIVAHLQRDLNGERTYMRRQQTALGAMVSDAVIQVLDVDFSVMNSGSIRNSLSAGAISRRDILEVLPFKDKLVIVETHGSDLLLYLKKITKILPGTGAFPQFYGITLPRSQPLRMDNVLLNGEPLVADRSYRFGITHFMAYGAGFYAVKDEPETFKLEMSNLYQSEILEQFLSDQAAIKLSAYFEYAQQLAMP